MEKTMKQLAGEIRAGRAPEQNLPELMNRMSSAYGMLSFYNLDMELSMLLESKDEGMIKPGRTVKEMEEALVSVMKRTLLAPFQPEVYDEAIKELIALREKVIARMDILTAYTDLFILYEHVMNRLETVFEEQEPIEAPMDNDAVAREILQWIFSEEEPALVNEHIKEMLSCLPVRMTKGKFLELVENAFWNPYLDLWGIKNLVAHHFIRAKGHEFKPALWSAEDVGANMDFWNIIRSEWHEIDCTSEHENFRRCHPDLDLNKDSE